MMRKVCGKGSAAVRQSAAAASLWFALGTVLFLSAIPAQVVEAQTAAKTVEGKVLSNAGAPLPGSIIYLQDDNTKIVKSSIATANGSYRFSQLPANTDYRLWAKYNGERSKDKLISSFDTKLTVTYDLKIGK